MQYERQGEAIWVAKLSFLHLATLPTCYVWALMRRTCVSAPVLAVDHLQYASTPAMVYRWKCYPTLEVSTRSEPHQLNPLLYTLHTSLRTGLPPSIPLAPRNTTPPSTIHYLNYMCQLYTSLSAR